MVRSLLVVQFHGCWRMGDSGKERQRGRTSADLYKSGLTGNPLN